MVQTITASRFISSWHDIMSEKKKDSIRKTAQAILDARNLYPECSLADLYDDLTMPPELRIAHQNNDKAVWKAYGCAWPEESESDCVAYLIKLYYQKSESKK